MLENWEIVTPLEFKSSFAHLWRDKNADWCVKLTDYDGVLTLKAEILRDAFKEAERIFLEKKYLVPKKRKVARARKKKAKDANPEKKSRKRKT